jgi:2-hydroxy-3-oxopropionate reductase
MTRNRVGFIGLGIMGEPVVRNLVDAGFDVHVSSLVAADVAEVSQLGVAEPDNRAVASSADIVITMVPDTIDVEQILFGLEGIAELLPGAMPKWASL